MTHITNLGESIVFLGVMIAVGMTQNYWLLLFLILPISLWSRRKHGVSNSMIEEEHDLKMQKLREEIRLLKKRKY